MNSQLPSVARERAKALTHLIECARKALGSLFKLIRAQDKLLSNRAAINFSKNEEFALLKSRSLPSQASEVFCDLFDFIKVFESVYTFIALNNFSQPTRRIQLARLRQRQKKSCARGKFSIAWVSNRFFVAFIAGAENLQHRSIKKLFMLEQSWSGVDKRRWFSGTGNLWRKLSSHFFIFLCRFSFAFFPWNCRWHRSSLR